MHRFLRSFSYIFHPLFMPIIGTIIYFQVTPKFVPESFYYAKMFALVILTVIVPILFYLLFQNLGVVSSPMTASAKERRLPLLAQILIVVLIIKTIISGYEFVELFYFYVGILMAAVIALIGALFNLKASLHLIGLTGVGAFIFGLSVHYTISILPLLALVVFAVGGVTTSRIYMKAHSASEVVLGFLIGGLTQAVLFHFWV
ncbi:MAG: hypothetical protein WBG71_03285 [Leeuwenhoekiella sp.]